MLRPVERRQKILRDIGEIDGGLIPQLSEKYAVSEMTIRRDLKVLEEEGLIKRTWGGAILWPPERSEPFVLSRERRERLHMSYKEAIACHAARHWVQDGDILILEGGTTVTAMAHFLQPFEELTVVTNGLYTADKLQRKLSANATIICTGGILRPESSTFVGPITEQFFREFHGQRLFLSATGLTMQAGLTDPKMLETQVKRAMVECADEIIVLLDSTKFGVKSLMTVLDLDRVSCLITDDGAPADVVNLLCAQGINVTVIQVA